jgi:hypothetical protein
MSPEDRFIGAILIAAFTSFLFSVGLWFIADQKDEGLFVGVWVPSILAFGALLEARRGNSRS